MGLVFLFFCYSWRGIERWWSRSFWDMVGLVVAIAGIRSGRVMFVGILVLVVLIMIVILSGVKSSLRVFFEFSILVSRIGGSRCFK